MTTDLHRLTVTDLAPSIAKDTVLLFRTREEALGYAAKRGNMHGYLDYRLDGRMVHHSQGEAAQAGEPVGYIDRGNTYLYAAA